MDNQQVQTPQTTEQPIQNSQKTSFWDFWHKKNYVNMNEKIIDFVFGILFCAFLVYLFWIILNKVNTSRSYSEGPYDKFPELIGNNPIVSGVYYIFLILLGGRLFSKREYIFFGAISLLAFFYLFPYLIVILMLATGGRPGVG